MNIGLDNFENKVHSKIFSLHILNYFYLITIIFLDVSFGNKSDEITSREMQLMVCLSFVLHFACFASVFLNKLPSKSQTKLNAHQMMF